MTSLVIAAHHDDETLGMGATIHQLDDVYVWVCCIPEDDRQKIWQFRTVLDILGAQRVHAEMWPDQRLDMVPLAEIASFVTRFIADLEPETVYTHWAYDLNGDHRRVSEAVSVACRPSTTSVKRLYQFEVPSSTEWSLNGFKPTRYAKVSDEAMAAKCRALQCYDSEVQRASLPRNPQGLYDRAAYWGQHVDTPWAEPFVLVREVE